jgi:hypothetical protein
VSLRRPGLLRQRYQGEAQGSGPIRQALQQLLTVSRLVGVDPLAHVLGPVLQEPVDAFGDLARRGEYRFDATAACLDAAVERPQGILGVMTALRGQAEGTCRQVTATPYPPALDLARRALMLRAQAQPARKVLRRGPLAHVGTDLAQDHQGRVFIAPFQDREIVAAHAVQGRAHAKNRLVATATAAPRLGHQFLTGGLVGERREMGLQLRIALPQELLVLLL